MNTVTALLLSTAIAVGDGDPVATYNEAIDLFNGARVAEAVELLRGLLDEHPDYYPAYPTYWDALGRTASTEAVHEHVRATIPKLEQVPRDDRTENYYHACMTAARVLEDTRMREAVLAEVVERFPRGLEAQQVKLHAARDHEDPRTSVALLRAYRAEFPGNKSWVQLAARDAFGEVKRNPDAFSIDELIEAAEAYDAASVEYIPVYGNPTVRLAALIDIADALAARDPARTGAYADRGIAFIREMAPQTDEFDETVARNFDAVKLVAAGRLERWDQVRTLAAELVPEAGSGEALRLTYWLSFKEPEVRAVYARALLAGDDTFAAHREMALAAALDTAFAAPRDELLETHSIDDAQRQAIDAAVQGMLDARGLTRKRKLLAREQNVPAPAFTLPDLDGRPLSLADLRGKVVVLDFWATWCGPCIAELKQIKKAYEKYERMPVVEFVAISIDSDKSKVPPFVEQNGYRFPVLLADGRVEADYIARGTGIPQLFVIDRDGNIRFHENGYAADHFLQHLDWMIQAAMKEAADP